MNKTFFGTATAAALALAVLVSSGAESSHNGQPVMKASAEATHNGQPVMLATSWNPLKADTYVANPAA